MNNSALTMHVRHAAHDSPEKLAAQHFLLNVIFSCGMHTAYCKCCCFVMQQTTI